MNALVTFCHFCDAHGPKIVFSCQPYRNEEERNARPNRPEVGGLGLNLNLGLDLGCDDQQRTQNNQYQQKITQQQQGVGPGASSSKLDNFHKFRNWKIFYGRLDESLTSLAYSTSSESDEDGGSDENRRRFFGTGGSAKNLDLSDTCAACRLSDTLKPAFLTNDHVNKVSYLGSQYPYNPVIYSVAKQACVRSLSCEVCPDSEGPIFFGDEQNGYCLCYPFAMQDSQARGFRRWYSICIVTMDKILLLNFYNLLCQCLKSIVDHLQNESNKIFDNEQSKSGENLMQIAGSGRLSWMPAGFMKDRATGRVTGTARPITELTGDEQIFLKMQRFFVWILKLPSFTITEQIFDGLPSQDDLVRLELTEEENLKLDSDFNDFGGLKSPLFAYNNCSSGLINKSKSNSHSNLTYSNTNNASSMEVDLYSIYDDDKLPYAGHINNQILTPANNLASPSANLNMNLNTGINSGPNSLGGFGPGNQISPNFGSFFNSSPNPSQTSVHESVYNLRLLYQIFGLEAFKILACHVVIGNQIVVKSETPKIAEMVINALQFLLPVGCCRTVFYSNHYLEPWKCNFLGLTEFAPVPEIQNSPAQPGQNFNSPKKENNNETSVNDSFVVLTAKLREKRKSGGNSTSTDQNIQLDYCAFRLHHVGVPPEEYPSILDRLLMILSESSGNLSIRATEKCLQTLKEEWLNKSKLYFQLQKQNRLNVDQRNECFRKIAKIDRQMDEMVVKFWQAGLSKQYKTYVMSKVAQKTAAGTNSRQQGPSQKAENLTASHKSS